MAYLVVVDNYEEFENLAQAKDIKISQAIVEKILENINTKKRHIHVLEVEVREENAILDLTVDREEFVSTLEKNLEIYAHHEMYEDCVKIQDAIKVLQLKK